MAALKMYHLAMKPAVGGKPPSESRKIVISVASPGCVCQRPA